MPRGLAPGGAAGLVVLCLALPLPANTPISHEPFSVRQAYSVSSGCPPLRFAGFSGPLQIDECSLPGFFDIDPGIRIAGLPTVPVFSLFICFLVMASNPKKVKNNLASIPSITAPFPITSAAVISWLIDSKVIIGIDAQSDTAVVGSAYVTGNSDFGMT